MRVRRTGEWSLARQFLSEAPVRLREGLETSLAQEAHELRKEIVQGITRQAPGGEKLKPISPLTEATRAFRGFKGTKALMVRADLRNAIAAIVQAGSAFIGVPRKARGEDGQAMVDVAKVHEYGSDPVVVPMTAAMRRFLFAMLSESGAPREPGSGKGVIVFQIPPRPFLRPAFESFAKGARQRFAERLGKNLKLVGR